MKVEIDVSDLIAKRIMKHQKIEGKNLTERMQWLWNQVLNNLPSDEQCEVDHDRENEME